MLLQVKMYELTWGFSIDAPRHILEYQLFRSIEAEDLGFFRLCLLCDRVDHAIRNCEGLTLDDVIHQKVSDPKRRARMLETLDEARGHD